MPPPQSTTQQLGGGETWQVRVLREQVTATSVGVLVEVCGGYEVRQHWGGSVIGGDGIGPAMARAQQDGVERAMHLFSPKSGIPSPFLLRGVTSAPTNENENEKPEMTQDGTTPLPRSDAHDPMSVRSSESCRGVTGNLMTVVELSLPTDPPSQPADEQSQIPIVSVPMTPPTSSGSQQQVTPPPAKLCAAPYQDPSGSSLKTDLAGVPPAGPTLQSIMIVDDDNTNVKILQRAFVKAKGFKIATGDDGQDVIRLLINQNERFDVVLVDENMRHMNGSTATTELRKHEARNGVTNPQLIIVTSGNTAATDHVKYKKAGFNGIIPKPLRVKTVVKSVTDYIRFWEATTGSGLPWKPGQQVPTGCLEPELRSSSSDDDRYFFGDLEMFHDST